MTVNEEIYDNFVNEFAFVLREKTKNLQISKLIFLCVGTDRITGDSFGPLVGYKLEELFKNEEKIEIIGTLENGINMQNVSEIIENIKNKYEDPFLIAIDAAFSNKNNVGRIVVSKNKMNIGGNFGKRNILVGDISIKGIVAKDLRNPRYNFRLLQNTSLNLIMNMADTVACGIYNVINV